MSATAKPAALPRPSMGEPLRIAVFRALWIGALVSDIGTWMQTVGAQWLLVHEPNAPALVSLVQTAQALPILLLALPAGVLADSFDRRHLLIVVQGMQTVVALLLTILTVAGAMPPALLLLLTFALGVGAAVQAPAYQALIPDPRRPARSSPRRCSAPSTSTSRAPSAPRSPASSSPAPACRRSSPSTACRSSSSA